MSRDVTLSCQEVTDGKQRAEKLVEILSGAVYAHLKKGVSYETEERRDRMRNGAAKVYTERLRQYAKNPT
jgi:hypothetical protein